MKKSVLSILLILGVVLFNFGIDRYTKLLAVEHLEGKPTVQVIGDFFILHFAENKGAFLSLGSTLGETGRFVLLAIIPAIALVVGLGYLFWKQASLDRFHKICWATLIGGGLANIWDRLFNEGHVVDFMNFGIGSLRTGILNVADLSITFSVLALFLVGLKKDSMLPEKKEPS
jgi:signal peptidase II